MTSVEFLKLCVRRWYVLLAGLATTVVLTVLAAGPNTVYFSRTTVNILEQDPNHVRIVGFFDPNQIQVAHILAARVNNGVKTPLASSPDVDLYAMGILNGTHAQIRNVGGQWLSNVTEPVVELQSVGSSPEQVKRQMSQQLTDLGVQLSTVENQLKVADEDRLLLQANPSDPQVTQQVSRFSRAALGYGLGGLLITFAAVYWFDRVMVRRTIRRAAVEAWGEGDRHDR